MQVARYRVRLDLEPEGGRFLGAAEIAVADAPESIVFHAQELTVDRLLLDGRPHPFRLVPEAEELRLGPSAPGAHSVAVSFSGRIAERGLVGLYRCRFPGGAMVVSMMFPNGARRVFPCVDDPAVKSVFEFTLVGAPGSVAISNTDGDPVPRSDGRTEVRFRPTPPMSTYLLFLASGPFAWHRGPAGPVRIDVALPPGREAAGRFAAEHAHRSLRAFGEYYGIPYPLPKLDLVSVPDFWAGAMENWGAIAFQETRLLAEADTGARARRRIRETVSHEIAHQWFGNLVTMVAWNDFWLNESFASFMQARIDARLYPGLDTESDFYLALPRWGLRGDALRATHPVEVPVRSAAELGQIADEITYGKGAAVLQMIEAYLGEPAFREGIRRYLVRHAYANARSEDLWASLEAASGEPVGRIMEAWVRRPGYPVLSVRERDGRIEVRQRRFFADGGADAGELWPVPFTLERDGVLERRLLTGPVSEIPGAAGRSFRANPGRTGFYRVRYEGPLAGAMVDRYDDLPDVDRWGMLHDAYAFLLSGDLPFPLYARLLERAARWPTPLTGGEVALDAMEIAPLLGHRPELAAALLRYFGTALAGIGPAPADGEGEATGALRGTLSVARVRLDPEFAALLAGRFAALEQVPADLKLAVAEAYGATAAPGAVAGLADLMFRAPSEEAARRMVSALARRPRAEELREVLDLALDPRMPVSRAWALAAAATTSGAAPKTAWEWLVGHLPELDRLLAGTPLLSSLLEGALPVLGPFREEEVRSAFPADAYPSAERGIRKGLEGMEIHAAFLRRPGP